MALYPKPHKYNARQWAGLRVGLLGGSFNPPHEGHLHISQIALKSLQLDVIWWLVTPQNPLKGKTPPLPLDDRMTLCKEMVNHPKILISDIEKDLGTTITYNTIKKLNIYFPKTEFIWITGMDNACSIHKWNNWKDLLEIIPTAHIARAPISSIVQNCPLRLYKKQKHITLKNSSKVPLDSGQTYWITQKKMMDISSTEIRENTTKTKG